MVKPSLGSSHVLAPFETRMLIGWEIKRIVLRVYIQSMKNSSNTGNI